MGDDFLKTLKKHIDDGIIEAVPQKISKTQIHNFGESMKGINEFIGAVQVLSLNLTKVKNLSEKIEWINDLLAQEDNENTASMLRMQKNTHIANIKYVCGEAKFLGVNLFGTSLSCVVSGKEFALCVESPIEVKKVHIPSYCTEKLQMIESLMSALNARLYSDDENDGADRDSSADSAMIRDYAENLARV